MQNPKLILHTITKFETSLDEIDQVLSILKIFIHKDVKFEGLEDSYKALKLPNSSLET